MELPTDEATSRILGWVEHHVGGRVHAIERQGRWRPAWYVDVERDGAAVRLYVRGSRGPEFRGTEMLDHEYRIMRVLESEGIPVPHLYGMMDDPAAIVMECAPGRESLATAEDDEERRSVLDHYIDVLIAMHSIDVRRFEAAGVEIPKDAESIALALIREHEPRFRAKQRRPEPMLDFIVRWVHRNAPTDRFQPAFVHGDSGQFLFDRGRVTAVLDFELAQVNDPLLDLASLRTRDLSEPLGDLTRALRRYAALTDVEIDRAALDYHTVQWAIVTPLGVAPVVHDPPPGLDPIVYREWYLSTSRVCIEVIADRLGMALPPLDAPPSRPTQRTPLYESLLATLGELPTPSEYETYRVQTASQLTRYLARDDDLGPALRDDEAEETSALLGRTVRADDLRSDATEQMLADVVNDADPGQDPELAAFFHRRLMRDWLVIAPVATRMVNPLQPLGDL
jgi:aminoglycoside phosphotransferase (APT) family kinase protein